METSVASEVFYDYRNHDPTILLHRVDLKLLAGIVSPVPSASEREIPTEPLPAQLRRESFSALQRGNYLDFRGATLCHSVSGVRQNADLAWHTSYLIAQSG
jgi:hypothetical protein